MASKNKTTEDSEIKEGGTTAPETPADMENEQKTALEEEIAALNAKIEALMAELAAANDKYLRMLAEYDNFRKRSAHDRVLAKAEATEDALKNILPIGDDLARASAFSDPAAVAKGIELLQKSFTAALSGLGVTEIEAQGLPFDPELHNAVMHIEDETLGESVVVEVLQKGYRQGDRVLRYAMVKVAN